MAGHNENDRRDFEDWASMNGMVPPWSDDETTLAYQGLPDAGAFAHGAQQSTRSVRRDESTQRAGSGVRRVVRARAPEGPRIPSLRAALHHAADAERAKHELDASGRPNTLVGVQPSAALGPRSSLLERDADEYAAWLPRTPLFLSAAAFGVLGGLWFGHTTLDATVRMPTGGSGAAMAQLPFAAEPETADDAPAALAEPSHAKPVRVGSGTDSEPLAALAATSGGKQSSDRAKNRHEAMAQRREAAKARREAAAQARREAKEGRQQAARERREALKERHAAAASERQERAEARKAAAAEKRAAAKAQHGELAEARKAAAAEKRAAAKAHHDELAEARRGKAEASKQAKEERREAAKAHREELAEARKQAQEERREAAKARKEEAAEARRVAMEERRERAAEREAPDEEVASAGGGAQGTLRINSRPWAQVFVDGRLVGYTPQVGFPISAGRHSVRLVNPTFSMSKIFDVKVAAGERVTRIETLED